MLEEALANFAGTVILISHDRHFIDAVCNEIWEVDSGRVTPFLGDYSNYCERVARGDRPEPLPLGLQEKKVDPKKKQPRESPKVVPEPAKADEKPALDWSGGNTVRKRKSRVEKREAAQYRQRRSLERRVLRLPMRKLKARFRILKAA